MVCALAYFSIRPVYQICVGFYTFTSPKPGEWLNLYRSDQFVDYFYVCAKRFTESEDEPCAGSSALFVKMSATIIKGQFGFTEIEEEPYNIRNGKGRLGYRQR